MAEYEVVFRRIGVAHQNHDSLALVIQPDDGTIEVRQYRTSNYGQMKDVVARSTPKDFMANAHWKDRNLLKAVLSRIGRIGSAPEPISTLDISKLEDRPTASIQGSEG